MAPKTPYVPKELVEHLERLFPDRCPDPGTPMDAVWIAAGRADVVRKLRKMCDEQTQRALTNNPE